MTEGRFQCIKFFDLLSFELWWCCAAFVEMYIWRQLSMIHYVESLKTWSTLKRPRLQIWLYHCWRHRPSLSWVKHWALFYPVMETPMENNESKTWGTRKRIRQGKAKCRRKIAQLYLLQVYLLSSCWLLQIIHKHFTNKKY